MKKIVFILCCTLLLQSCDTFWDIILAITEFGTPYEETRRGKEEKEEREQAQWRLEALRLAEEQEQERQREEQRRNDEAPESITGAGFGCVEGDESHNDPISGHIGLEKSLYWLSRSFSIVSGLGISYQGVKYTEPEYSGTLRLSYISIPVLFNYQSERQIYGEIGLQPGFLLSARDKIKGEGSMRARSIVKNFELGLPVGGGYWINNKMGVGIRGTYGLTNMQNWGSPIKNHNWMVAGVFKYRLIPPEEYR